MRGFAETAIRPTSSACILSHTKHLAESRPSRSPPTRDAPFGYVGNVFRGARTGLGDRSHFGSRTARARGAERGNHPSLTRCLTARHLHLRIEIFPSERIHRCVTVRTLLYPLPSEPRGGVSTSTATSSNGLGRRVLVRHTISHEKQLSTSSPLQAAL